ncbi:surfeit locus 1 family protein [Noviherbaspirillum humi]|uniref:SURF1-like protein n=1 Tax=Noviherbaspirillum humi TaxID=1688639 RepID=A0A239DQ58_9BURK|nr:SURF1 family protein [Noviherbaspirillum humi]SNS34467.1 surfeit locus 1 family protein [Noviherbaspirillum humi]
MTQRPAQGGEGAFTEAPPRSRSRTTRVVLAILAAMFFAAFCALGTWQVKRLHWKQDLIERVNQRVHAEPVPAPGPERWPAVTAESDEYRHVRLSGVFLHEHAARVQAVTDLGSGYWLLTPLRQADGSIVLVNRGFIPPGQIMAKEPPAADRPTVTVTGLLRISEPNGGFLRKNDPAADRWYSRDVQAIAAARRLERVAPYFVDADASQADAEAQNAGAGGVRPTGGLTVIAFHNSHLVYAVTWYALALMVAAAFFWVVRDERKRRRG